jgi:transcriptional regulator with XRE-family HTH domain
MNNQNNRYAMTDSAIAKELGRRLEQMRLEANIPQKAIADELGISEGTYRHAINGKAKFEVIIGILRVLGKLENVDNFLPELPFSPIELLKLDGKKRQRAVSKRAIDTQRTEDDLNW